jgi:3-hydroxyisobutyryl-CoA hydrolase
MARKIIGRLKEYSKSDLANIIVIKGAGRAFCAGGDVAALAQWNKNKEAHKSNDYFALEYKLDHLIASYQKPYIAYMDGITMGGGVGLSVHAPFRIATENTVFAMPETTIGFYPEVGASFFLPRMDGQMGTYLALTSEQLKGVDVFYHGIATHYLHSTSLESLSQRLAELQFKDYTPLQDRYKLIASTISEFTTGLPTPRPTIYGAQRKAIDSCFSHRSATEILAALQDLSDSPSTPVHLKTWASKTIATIRERSPTGVAVSLRELQLGRTWSIARAFQNEYDISSHFMNHTDFMTGVYARLIERKNGRPDWKPATLEEVREEDVETFFVGHTPEAGGRLRLLESGEGADFKEYPHTWIGLPKEEEVLGMKEKGLMREEVVQHFLRERGGKVGVREKVEEVWERHET